MMLEIKYTSKSIRKECKSIDCKNRRRMGSAYCQECSDKIKAKQK